MSNAKIVWDNDGDRKYETGVDHGVLYPRNSTSGEYDVGEAWNGLTGVTENPSGAEATPLWADNIKYLNMLSAETFAATVTAYMYPDSFAECDGSKHIRKGVTIGQQPRKPFGLSYRTIVGNDVAGDAYGYKIHMIYGCTATPSDKAYSTKNDSPSAIEFSWTVNTTPVNVEGEKPTAHLSIESNLVSADKLKVIEAILYGTNDEEASEWFKYADGSAITTPGPRLPLPDEIVKILGDDDGVG